MNGGDGQTQRPRTYLMDPSQLSREGWRQMLRSTPFELRGDGGSLTVLEEDVQRGEAPELVLLDVPSDGEEVGATVTAVRELLPDSRIVVLAVDDRPEVFTSAFAAGADGFVSKDTSFEALLESLRLVCLGERVYPTELISAALRTARGQPTTSTAAAGMLSPRERQVLNCLVEGMSNKMIARKLGVTETTVKLHVKNILRKINVRNRTQAAIWAIENRLIGSPEGPESGGQVRHSGRGRGGDD